MVKGAEEVVAAAEKGFSAVAVVVVVAAAGVVGATTTAVVVAVVGAYRGLAGRLVYRMKARQAASFEPSPSPCLSPVSSYNAHSQRPWPSLQRNKGC